MRDAKRSAVYVILAAATLMAVAVAVTAIWFVIGHRDSTSVSASAAEAEFATIRSRFSQHPLIDMAIRQPATAETPTQPPRPLRTFHTVVFDTRESERLVRISVPYWFARLYARHDGAFRWLGELTFLDDTEFDSEPISMTLAQVEQVGPSLLVDYRHANGGQFISWVE